MMTPEQSAAYINGMAASMLVRMEGMKAENVWRERRGESPAYNESAFEALVVEYGVHHNGMLTVFEEAEC